MSSIDAHSLLYLRPYFSLLYSYYIVCDHKDYRTRGCELALRVEWDNLKYEMRGRNTQLREMSSRVSNLKYECVRIDSKTVVFIRANPGKKETTDRSGSHVNFIRKQCTSPKVVSPEKWYVTNIKQWA